MKRSPHTRRSAEIAREKLAAILQTKVSDPALAGVVVTGCDVSIDRSFIRAYVACPAEEEEAVAEAFGRAKGHIRRLLGRALGWRVTPELDLRIDPSTEEAERITEALRHVPPTMTEAKDDEGYPLEARDPGEGERS